MSWNSRKTMKFDQISCSNFMRVYKCVKFHVSISCRCNFMRIKWNFNQNFMHSKKCIKFQMKFYEFTKNFMYSELRTFCTVRRGTNRYHIYAVYTQVTSARVQNTSMIRAIWSIFCSSFDGVASCYHSTCNLDRHKSLTHPTRLSEPFPFIFVVWHARPFFLLFGTRILQFSVPGAPKSIFCSVCGDATIQPAT